MAPSHPLSILSIEETNLAREIVLAHHDKEVIDFREIFLQEPARLAKCQYDVIGSDRIPSYHESVVDIGSKKRTKHEVIGKEHQAALTL